ncbi:hypothetical protein ACHAQH_001169 [Verticillium albo-atrum]
MADIFGATAAVAGLLEGALRLIKRVRKAYERQKELSEILDKHMADIESIGNIVDAILDEDALQTAVVTSELTKIRVIAGRLVKCLKELDPGSKGRTRQVAHHLLHGTKEEETLADVMRELERAKTSLILHVQLANVGLTRMVRDRVFADTEIVHRIDQLLVQMLGQDHGLRLAGLVESQETPPQYDQTLVCLRKADVASLGEDTVRGEVRNRTCLGDDSVNRIIVGNTAQDLAIQLLGPVGKDLWENARVRIENNKASGQAVQIANSTDFDTFRYLLDHQARMAA